MEDRRPDPKTATVLLRSGLMFLAHAVAGLFLLAALVMAVPTFLGVFEQLEAELPAITQSMIWLSIYAVDYWYLMGLLLIVFDGAALLILNSLPRNTLWLADVWFAFVLLAVIALLSLVSVSMAAPLARGTMMLTG